MFTRIRFTKILVAVAMTASVAACNDIASSGAKSKRTTTPVVTTTEPPKPIEVPPPTETPPPGVPLTPPPTVATEVAKPPVTVVTVDNDDDGPRPADALIAARKLLDDKQYDKALTLANLAIKRMPKRS